MWFDALAVALLGLFIVLGAWRGALASGLALASLVCSYAAAILLGARLAPLVSAVTGASGVLALVFASSAAFLGCFLVFGVLGFLLRRGAAPPEGLRDRFLGGVFGGLRGFGIVMLLGYLALWVDAARVSGLVASMPELGSSAAAAVTSEIVESAVAAGLDGEGPADRMMVRVAARPAEAVGALSGIVDSAPFAALREDEMFWTYVESGNVDAALARRSFLELQRDPAMRERLAGLGLVSEEAGEDPRVFREAVAGVMREVAPRLRAVRQDPALQELLEDPEVMAMLQSGDTLGLLRHPGFRALIDRIISQSAPS